MSDMQTETTQLIAKYAADMDALGYIRDNRMSAETIDDVTSVQHECKEAM